MVYIEEEKFKQLLGQAYEAGWHGILELKDSTVEEIYYKYKRNPEGIDLHQKINAGLDIQINTELEETWRQPLGTVVTWTF